MSCFLLGGLAVPSALAEGDNAVLFEQLSGLGPLLPPDENGVRLPAGFKSRIVARSARPVLSSSSYIWHEAPDGGACFAAEDGGWVYVSNSEIKQDRGGVGAIRFDAEGNIIDAYPILRGTNQNCAGGKTPWNTWLSCEEIDRGMVYECDPFGEKEAEARPALGCFQHEAVAVDPEQGYLYLTEDLPDGGFYRFRSSKGLPDLREGVLEIAEVVTDRSGKSQVVWHAIDDPSAQRVPTRYQVKTSSRFNGGEGISWSRGIIFFTTKGDNRVWFYNCSSQELDVLYDASTAAEPHLTGVDNVTITSSGDVLVAEDGGDMQLVLLTLSGQVIPVIQVVGQDESEICGPAFSPAFDRLYFSSQRGPANRNDGGITYEISYA